MVNEAGLLILLCSGASRPWAGLGMASRVQLWTAWQGGTVGIVKNWPGTSTLFFLKIYIFIYSFRERGREAEREADPMQGA